MQATARMLPVMFSKSLARRRLMRSVRLVIRIPQPISRDVRISHAVPLFPQRAILAERNELVAVAIVWPSAEAHADYLHDARRQSRKGLYCSSC